MILSHPFSAIGSLSVERVALSFTRIRGVHLIVVNRSASVNRPVNRLTFEVLEGRKLNKVMKIWKIPLFVNKTLFYFRNSPKTDSDSLRWCWYWFGRLLLYQVSYLFMMVIIICKILYSVCNNKARTLWIFVKTCRWWFSARIYRNLSLGL